ncbi:MAG: type IV pilin N-terminal domain-containing protein [archaeon]
MQHSDPPSKGSERAISEMTAVGTLIGVALLLVVGIGLNVFLLAPGDTGAPDASFSFRYIDQSGTLIVTHDDGDSIRAGDLYVEGEDGNATWAELAGSNASTEVEPDDMVQVGEDGAYGASLQSYDRVEVVWRNATANQTAVLGRWNGDSDG